MKYVKITLVLFLIVLFSIQNPVQGQSKSKEELGNALATTISGKDLAGFKSLVLPAQLAPRHEENFWEMVNLNEAHTIDWSQLNFVVLYKYESKEEGYDPFLIHAKLKNSDFNHFYFSAVRYKGQWFLEDKMELTKAEKYAPK